MLRVDFFSEVPESACHKYRVEHPVGAINDDDDFIARYSDKWVPEFSSDDLYFFQRNSSKDALKIIYHLCKDGRPVIYDVDDDIFHIPESNPVHELYLQNPSLPWHQINGIRMASMVTVSCEGLVTAYKHINPNIRVLPNCLRASDWQNVSPILRESSATRIFWGGSPTHKDDLETISKVLVELKRRYEDRVEIVIMGDTASLGCAVTHIPFGTYMFFQQVMVSCNIGLAPMADNRFNYGKSDLRLKELGAAGLATVASAIGEYDKPESGAFICKSEGDWLTSLTQLIENEHTLCERSERMQRWAMSWTIANRIDLWKDLFREVSDGHTRGSSGEGIRVQAQQRPSQQINVGKVRVGDGTFSRDHNPPN